MINCIVTIPVVEGDAGDHGVGLAGRLVAEAFDAVPRIGDLIHVGADVRVRQVVWQAHLEPRIYCEREFTMDEPIEQIVKEITTALTQAPPPPVPEA